MMTLQEQFTRAERGIKTAREGLRKGGNDAMLDHWASRLMFWKDEASRLRRIHEEESTDRPERTLGEQYAQTDQGDAA